MDRGCRRYRRKVLTIASILIISLLFVLLALQDILDRAFRIPKLLLASIQMRLVRRYGERHALHSRLISGSSNLAEILV